MNRFANASVVCEGWYPMIRSRSLRRGAIKRISIGKRDVVLYRDLGGAARAVERACGHLGADLSHGEVTARGIQCAFHRWCWGADGACTAGGGVVNGARIRTFEVRERWGLIWVWGGESPAYELPSPEPENQKHLLRLPPQRLKCHPHVVLGNGLDLSHVVPVHRFHCEGSPVVETESPHRLSVTINARFHGTLLRTLLRLSGASATWRFTNIGPSLAWVQVFSPTPFELVWVARPLPDGTCWIQTIFFLPRWRALVRALPMMTATTWADRRILDGLQFRPGFVASDAVFARYAQLVEELPEW